MSLSHTAGHVGHWPPSTQPVGCGPGIPGQVCLYPRSVTEISPTESASQFSRLESLRHMVYYQSGKEGGAREFQICNNDFPTGILTLKVFIKLHTF